MQIFIKLNAEDKELKETTIFLDGKELASYWNNSINISLFLNELSEGVHTLTVNAVFFSGSGSLADLMGLEGYEGELSWTILVIHDVEKSYKVDYRLNEEGFLEIYWENDLPEKIIEKYLVCNSFDKASFINDPKQKSYIDYEYVCGYQHYEVYTYLKSGVLFMKSFTIEKPVPKIHIEEMGIHQLRIYWDKPFANGRFRIEEEYFNVISSNMKDTTITIPQIFGKYRKFDLTIKPQKAEYDKNYNQFYVWGDFYQGFRLDLSNNPQYGLTRKSWGGYA